MSAAERSASVERATRARDARSRCRLCGLESPLVSTFLGMCGCIRRRPGEARPLIAEAHARARSTFGSPAVPPRTPGGTRCALCAHGCWIGEGELGYCGLR